MPKIIENLESRLIQEAKKQILEVGYSAVTIRSVASACGVGVGTVYNYFSSKDELAAAFMLEDWKQCIRAIQDTSCCAGCSRSVLRSIYDQLVFYASEHRALFRDESARASFAGAANCYHGILRSQLAAPLHPFCESEFAAEFIAEAMLTWTLAGKDFDEIYGIVARLCKE